MPKKGDIELLLFREEGHYMIGALIPKKRGKGNDIKFVKNETLVGVIDDLMALFDNLFGEGVMGRPEFVPSQFPVSEFS